MNCWCTAGTVKHNSSETGQSEGHRAAPGLWHFSKTPLIHGLVENKIILKFLCHNSVGEDKKSPQSILVIGRSFKVLHNFVKAGNLRISSFLNGDWESSEFCMPWFYYGFLLTLLWREKKDVARKNYCRGCSANLYGDHFFSSVILTSLCNSIAEVRINYRSSLFQKLVWSYNSYIKCQWNNQSPLDLFFVVSTLPLLHFQLSSKSFCNKYSLHLLILEVFSNRFSSSYCITSEWFHPRWWPHIKSNVN